MEACSRDKILGFPVKTLSFIIPQILKSMDMRSHKGGAMSTDPLRLIQPAGKVSNRSRTFWRNEEEHHLASRANS